jgi:uncharacterized membrane protein YcaP (DUF421 family)
MQDWLYKSAGDVPEIVLSVFVITIILIVYTRISGLRSFSKMSSFDFAITVAFGSVLASTVIAKEPRIFQSGVALGALYLLQYLISYIKARNISFGKLIDNEPILLMNQDGFIEDNLIKARVTKDEVRDKLRQANVLQLSNVKAVVFETTGDISVLHSREDQVIDRNIVINVRDNHLIN